jgi:hypothetical protein
MTAVLARLRAGDTSDDPVVDRLNDLSLRAARQGRTFSPRTAARALSSSGTVTPMAAGFPLLP